mmetsp:Transcript_177481/g.569207  ORF Transcript_177481/g.569207 Transcript_177481/m.569207 type:complete len:283 (-) Transcript_177481:92-940(-)
MVLVEEADDDDEDRAEKDACERRVAAEDRRKLHAERKVEIDRWLKAKIRRLFPPEDATGPPELDAWEDIPPRKVTDEERGVLAMFISVVHCQPNELNLANHHEIMEVARTSRWLEEDPCTLELLCQILRSLRAADQGALLGAPELRMEEMLLCAINTLAAPPRAGCSEGFGKLYELFALIGDPKSDKAWEFRTKYMKKEYAAEAIFESLMPSARRKPGAADPDDGEPPLLGCFEWCLIGVMVALLICLFLFVLFSRRRLAAMPALTSAELDIARQAGPSGEL